MLFYAFHANKTKRSVGLTVKFEPLRLQIKSCVSGIEKCIFFFYYSCRSNVNFDMRRQREMFFYAKVMR